MEEFVTFRLYTHDDVENNGNYLLPPELIVLKDSAPYQRREVWQHSQKTFTAGGTKKTLSYPVPLAGYFDAGQNGQESKSQGERGEDYFTGQFL